MSMRLLQQLDDLVASVGLSAGSRPGRLAVLTVGVPPEVPVTELVPDVAGRLARAGLPGVEVRARPVDGALRVMSMEFRR